MIRFAYRAYTRQGSIVRGEIDAGGREDALQQLRLRGLTAISVDPAKFSGPGFWRLEFRSRRAAAAARLAFVHELGVLLRARLPLDQAIRLLPEQAELRGCGALISAVSDCIAGGKTLGESLALYPELLQEHETAMIRAAEHTGSVFETLLQLAHRMQRQIELKARIKAALTYPAILLAMSLLTIVAIAAVLVPNLLPLFESARSTPPLIVRFFMTLQEKLVLFAAMGAMTSAALFVLVQRLKQNDKALQIKDRMLLRLPLVGRLIEDAETARTAGSLGLLLKGGVPLLQALSIAQKASSNRTISAAIGRAAEKVASGARLARAFAEFSVMPRAACHLAAIGEEANRLDELMMHIAEMHEAALRQRIEALMTIITPILTLSMGLLVAGLIMAVMKAITSVNDLVFT